MKLHVAQDQEFIEEEDCWRWSVWIEGPDDELDEIKEVTYKLHPTFKRPLRTTDDRASKFKLKTSGWGTFTIRVKVELKTGAAIKLEHELELFYPDGTPNLD